MQFRKLPIIAFWISAVLVLLSTPVAAGFQLRSVFCDFGPSPDWAATILNWKHVIAYGALSALGFVALRDRPFWQGALTLLAIMAGAELTQAIFADGNCRLRDMLPNIIAVGAGAAVVSIFRRMQSWKRKAWPAPDTRT
jgi:hypothetical protein